MTGSGAFLVFHVGGHGCAVDIACVQEINRNVPITKVFATPPFVRGIINLRGQIVTIIDLACRLLGTGGQTPGKNIIIRSGNELVGLLVDDVEDIVTPGPDELLPAPPHLPPGIGAHALGVLASSEALVIILDPDSIAS
jgi:purine-binding chemotaxis protein CheW